MHRSQFDELRENLKANKWSGYGDVPENLNVMLYLTNGKQKGKVGKLVSVDEPNLTIQVEGMPKTLSFTYTKIELADDDGKPIYANALDIAGRPVTGNNVICYSVSIGENSHALEIGKIIKTNPSGSLTVQPIIRNGEKLKPGYWNKPRANVRADRVIILPVDATLVTTWVLSDFELFHGDELENE